MLKEWGYIMKNKTVIVGVTGGIAAYKICTLVSDLKKKGYDVHVLMTKDAEQFITPLTFQTLSGNLVVRDLFSLEYPNEVHHIQLAKKADIFVIAPATANVIAKVANGIADDLLTTTFLAATCSKLIVPAMNVHMLENPITQDNLKKCEKYGIKTLESGSGYLACGDIGKGRLPEPNEIFDAIEEILESDKFLRNKKVLITAGPTQEALDPVRFITNHSSGKMGFALAKAARNFGADVTLITGPVGISSLRGVNTVSVTSAQEMFEAVNALSDGMDVLILSAAVADYRPKEYVNQKIHKSQNHFYLELERTNDILYSLGKRKNQSQILIGFAMETENLLTRAAEKLEKKNCDFMIANNLKEVGAGFQTDTNRVYIFSKNKVDHQDLGLLSKEDTAIEILKYCLKEGKL